MALPVTGLRSEGINTSARSWFNKNFTIADIAAESFDFDRGEDGKSDMSLTLVFCTICANPANATKAGLSILHID